ncbi:hypothetical protein CYLTODRAFT_353576, partial [Cylindrobasidium torrendii FP15055 ss-10]
LRTGHCALNAHLYNICAQSAPTPECPTCGYERETVFHFVMVCPTYQFDRMLMFEGMRYEKMDPTMKNLMNTEKGVRELLRYAHGTGRFNQGMFGDGLARMEANNWR